MKKKIFTLIVSLCISIQICFGAVITIIERDISYSITKTPGNKVTIEAKSGEIEGWTVNYGGVILDATGSFIMPNNNVEIEAIYDEPTSFPLIIEEYGQRTEETKTVGAEVTVSASANPNYLFMGWSATGIILTEAQRVSSTITFEMPSNPVRLVTEYRNIYTISYNANGGENAPASQSKIHGTPTILSGNTPNKSGYRFLGWSLNSWSTTATYQHGGNFTLDANTTLYAVWEEKDFTLTLETPLSTTSEKWDAGEQVMLEVSGTYGESEFVSWTVNGIKLNESQAVNPVNGFIISIEDADDPMLSSTIITCIMPANDVKLTANYSE